MLVTSYTPYALLGYLVALVALLIFGKGMASPSRGWVTGATLVAVAGAGFHAALLAPAYFGEHAEGPAELTVLTLNTRRGQADAAAVVRHVRETGAQVAVIEEVTPRMERALLGEGLALRLPNLGGASGPDGSGTMIFSTYPLTESASVPLGHGSYRIKVGAPTPFWLVAVHLSQPLNGQGSAWRGDWSVLEQVAWELDGPVLVAGDFNSTLEHRPMRQFLDEGFVDAARHSNAGWQPTYPNGVGLIAIDHVLARGAYTPIRTSTVAVMGTDHRALVARFALRPGK